MRILFIFRNGLCGYVLGLLLLSCLFTSCANVRQLTYMQGQFDTARLSQIKVSDPVIQKGDLLSIIVYSDNSIATSLYNQSVTGTALGNSNNTGGGGTGSLAGVSSSGTALPTTPGYQVDELGNIEFHGLGTLHVEGLTKSQLRDSLNAHFKEYLKNPYYTIRFVNYKFTMLGEINRPGVFNIPGERISLLEALGLAGDMTFYGRRDNVLVIRENNGKREFGRLNLTKPEILASPYYYLQQNDIVIVEQNKYKAVANDQVTIRNVSIATSIIATLAIVYSIFKK